MNNKNKKQAGKVMLYLPRNIRFNNVSLDFDASNITIEALQCTQLDLESDASKVTIKRLQVDEKTSVDNDMGNVEATMAGARSQYHVDRDENMSSIHVSKTDEVIGNKNITIDTDLGNVSIHFEGE